MIGLVPESRSKPSEFMTPGYIHCHCHPGLAVESVYKSLQRKPNLMLVLNENSLDNTGN